MNKTDYRHEIHHDGQSYRQILFYAPGDDRDKIRVYQAVDHQTLKYGAAIINWSAIGSVTIDQAQQFKNALDEAIAMAKLWNEKMGKKPEGIK